MKGNPADIIYENIDFYKGNKEYGIELVLKKVARDIVKRVNQGTGPIFLEFKKIQMKLKKQPFKK